MAATWILKPMRRMVAVSLLLQLATAPITTALPTADFAFQFTFGSCTLDTTTGLLTHDRAPRDQVSLRLADDQMAAIATSLEQIEFFTYPSPFIGTLQGQTAYSINAAAPTYRMSVQLGDKNHVVSWTDSTRPSNDEAFRLRTVFDRIIGFIRSQPGYATMTGRGADCP